MDLFRNLCAEVLLRLHIDSSDPLFVGGRNFVRSRWLDCSLGTGRRLLVGSIGIGRKDGGRDREELESKDGNQGQTHLRLYWPVVDYRTERVVLGMAGLDN